MLTLLLRSMHIGGKETTMLRLAHGLHGCGEPVQFLFMQKQGPLLTDIPAAIPVHDLGVARMRGLSWPLWRWLRRHKPPTLIVDGAEQAWLVRVLAYLCGYRPRIIAYEHFMRSHSQSVALRSPMGVRLGYRAASHVVAVSHAVKQDLVQYGVPEGHISVIHNPIDSDAIQRAAAHPVAHPWLEDRTIPIIAGMGRLAADKSYDDLLRGFATYRVHYPARLLLIGDGPERHRLRALAEDLSITDDVWFTGFLQNPYPYINASTLFVHCSKSEAFGNVIVEALALGKAILIQQAHGGMQEILAEGHGLVTPRHAPDAMAAAIHRLVSAPPDPEEQRARARAFSVATATQKMIQLLHE
jgi:glycosyltransferase involved in cell wall biosynthesis